jgi:hypothetical protein
MPGRNTKGFAAYGLMLGLAALNAGLLVACHRSQKPYDLTDPPSLSYRTTLILPTAGQPFTSVAPDVSAFYLENGVGSTETAGVTFSVAPALPSGLALNPGTGIIAGTPAAVSAQATYTIFANNVRPDGGGSTPFPVTLGVQAASPVTLDYQGTGAVSAAVGAAMTLTLPATAVTGGAATGFGVSPALPSGLGLNPSTGQVSGTPAAALPATVFTLTATTPVGSANAPFTLLVSATAPAAPLGLAYAGGPFSATLGQPFTGPAPAFANSTTALVYTVSPELPAGLALDPLLGVIAGTPTATSSQVSYTVTASNAGGLSQADLLLAVN